MAVNRLLDTNTVLYHLGGRLLEPAPDSGDLVSVITEMELLSYPGLDAAAEETVRALLGELRLVELTRDIREAAVAVRRSSRLKLPDAIIAGTAASLGVELVTNDDAFQRVGGLRVTVPRLRPAP